MDKREAWNLDGSKKTDYLMAKRKQKLNLSTESLASGISSSYYPTSRNSLPVNTQEMKCIIESWKTPLHNAAAAGRCDELNLLLEFPHINVNIQTKRYNEYEGLITLDNTPLHLAAKNGREQAVSILLKSGAACDILNSDGATALHLATINGASYEVVYNLAKEKKTLSMKDNKGRTALFCAAVEGWHTLIPILAEENIEDTDLIGETPLIAATKNGFSQTMKSLIEHGAYITKRDKKGNCALDYALIVDEKSIQDEEIFDNIVSQMLKSQPKEKALSHLRQLLGKYNHLKLKQSVFTLFDMIPELRAIQVIIHSKYLESDRNGFTPDQKEYQHSSITALQMIADTRDIDLAFHPCIRTVVDKKMWKIGNYFLLAEIIYFIFFLICIGFIFISTAVQPNPNIYDEPIDIVRGIVEVIVAILWVTRVFFFVLGIVTGLVWEYHRDTYEQGENHDKTLSKGKLAYNVVKGLASDPFNYYSVISIVSLFLVMPLRAVDSPAQWIFAVCAVIFSFLGLLKTIRLLPGFGTYVHTITLIMIYDVPKFTIVCITLTLVLSQCFFISLRVPYGSGRPDNMSAGSLGEEGMTSEYHWTFLLFVRLLLEGQSILEHNYLADHLNWMSSVIYMCALLLMIVILLNIFIAQVSDTYATSKSKSERVVALYRLEYIVRITVNTFGMSRKKGYVNIINLKGNYWKSLQRDSDDMYSDIRLLLEKQQSNFDQLKQCISTLKKMALLKFESAGLDKCSIQSDCNSTTSICKDLPEITMNEV
ncbi:Vanilloid receptor [Oopsacas minuta]|uniref:Vanilloid receptor n=1 Tax=Oopsacas minuta TaxID=111878 RepID=A0AAV7JPR9_9METZ|nr:Vanilloid receptor [Oopsacas minuta]